MIIGIDMTDDKTDDRAEKKRGLLIPLLVGLVLAAVAGGGGFWAVTSGPFAPDAPTGENADTSHDDAAGHDATDAHAGGHGTAPAVDVAFVPLETVVITLGSDIGNRDLIFTAALEVDPEHESEVARLSPRVLDVLNGYLRVITLDEVNDPTSLARIRAQLLRRIQVVTGEGRVSDLLVTQFVVN